MSHQWSYRPILMGNGCLPPDKGTQVVICFFCGGGGGSLSSWNCPPDWLPLALNLSSLHLTAWGLLFRIWCLPFHPLLRTPLQLYNPLQVNCSSDTWHGLVNTGYMQFTCACTAWKTLVNKPSVCWCTSSKVCCSFSLWQPFHVILKNAF